MLWIAALFGAAIAVYAAIQFRRYRGSDRWPVASATVESIQALRSQGSDGHHFYPFVSFSFLVDGERYSGEWSGPAFRQEKEVQDFLQQNTPVGAKLNARYKPQQPSLNLLDIDPQLLDRNRPIQLNL
jgi:hypothetical protein